MSKKIWGIRCNLNSLSTISWVTNSIFEKESIKFEFPIYDEEDFTILVEDCEVSPVFTKKEDFLKVEYDFTFCNTIIRTLSFSKYKDASRIEVTLKDKSI